MGTGHASFDWAHRYHLGGPAASGAFGCMKPWSPAPAPLHCSESTCGGKQGAGRAARGVCGSAARGPSVPFSGRTASSCCLDAESQVKAAEDSPEPWNERLADKWYELKSLSRSLGRQSKRKLKEATTEAVHAIKAAVDPQVSTVQAQLAALKSLQASGRSLCPPIRSL